MSKKLNYKEASERLEQIIRKIEHDNPDIDELTQLVEEAVELTQFCRNKLTKADEQITQIMARLDETPEK